MLAGDGVEALFEGGEDGGLVGGIEDAAPAGEETEADEVVAEEGAAVEVAEREAVFNYGSDAETGLAQQRADRVAGAAVRLLRGQPLQGGCLSERREHRTVDGIELAHMADNVGGKRK